MHHAVVVFGRLKQIVRLLAAAMTDFVTSTIFQRTGVITLECPRALKAPSLSMMRALIRVAGLARRPGD